jgi:hypothetical protein
MIPVTQLHDDIGQLIDKYGSPYFTTAEIDDFINRAQLGLLNELIYSRPKDINLNGQFLVTYEPTQHVAEAIAPFLITSPYFLMSTSGLITNVELNTALGGDYIHISNLKLKGGDPYRARNCFYARHNDIEAFQENTWKRPSDCLQYYVIDGDGLMIFPDDQIFEARVRAIINPQLVEFGVTDALWPAHMREMLVERTAKMMGISMRDQQLYQDATNEIDNHQK